MAITTTNTDQMNGMLAADQAKLGFGSILVAALRRVGGAIHSTIETMQIARMMSVLSSMSDLELEAMNLKRQDIPDHARKLLVGDNK